MFFQDGRAVYASAEARLYPHLDSLLGGYFHQDFDLFGDTLQEILATYRNDVSIEEREGTVSDIRRFLATHGPDPQEIDKALSCTFKPDVIVDGWEGLNAAQWLEEIARLLT